MKRNVDLTMNRTFSSFGRILTRIRRYEYAKLSEKDYSNYDMTEKIIFCGDKYTRNRMKECIEAEARHIRCIRCGGNVNAIPWAVREDIYLCEKCNKIMQAEFNNTRKPWIR